MKKAFIHIIVSILLTALLIFPNFVLAASPASDNLKKVGSTGDAPYKDIDSDKNDLASIVGVVIQAFLSLLGVLFLVYMLYGGYNWMVAQGDEDKVKKAKETIQRAIIGLIITIAAYAISFWVFDNLLASDILTSFYLKDRA